MHEFYATTAHVLPILLLALVWESRFLDTLQRQNRSGWIFWTKSRVRAYGLIVSTIVVADIAVTILVLAGAVPDSSYLRGVVTGGLILTLATLLTRICVDIVAATALTPEERASRDRPAKRG